MNPSFNTMATEHSNANIVSLGLPSIQPFNPSGDPSNLSQRWCKWKKSLEYFLLASGINDEKRKCVLLLHLIGADTQEIFETFSSTGEDYKSAMVKLDKLDKLEDLGIIEKVQEPTPWISPLVVVPETNGSVCLCLDMHHVNEAAVICEQHMIPKLDQLLQDTDGATVFSKINLTYGYHQLQLCKESKNLTAFATHKGIYR